jgi:Flp pilus assembly protein CpaB
MVPMQKILATRAGTIGFGVAVAAIAGLLIALYLSQYRSSVSKENQNVNVLVASNLIVKGTPGSLVGSAKLYQTMTVSRKDVKDGAITDPSVIRGRVAAEDLFPGQQLTATDFTIKPDDNLTYKLASNYRAVAVPLDTAHGLVGQLHTGDHVDVLAGFNVIPVDKHGVPLSQGGGQSRPVVKTIMQDVVVLDAPEAQHTGIGQSATQMSNVVLRLKPRQADEVAFASTNGTLWLSLRPQTGASGSAPGIVTVESMLLGIKPMTILHALGGKR